MGSLVQMMGMEGRLGQVVGSAQLPTVSGFCPVSSHASASHDNSCVPVLPLPAFLLRF
jgi:hypothetical protein